MTEPLLSSTDLDALALARRIIARGPRAKGFAAAEKTIAIINACLRARKPCESFGPMLFLAEFETEATR